MNLPEQDNIKNKVPIDPNDFAPIMTPNLQAILKVGSIVRNEHINHLSDECICTFPDSNMLPEEADTCSFFQLEKLGFDKEENNQKKLGSVFSAAAAMGSNVVMIIKPKDCIENGVDIYLGTSGTYERSESRERGQILYRSFAGNFQGCRSSKDSNPLLNRTETNALINNCFSSDFHAVAAVSGIASMRGNQDIIDSANIQSLDKVIESLSGSNYCLIFIARAVSWDNIIEMQEELEMLYTQFAPFHKCQLSLTSNEAKTVSETLTKGISKLTSDMNSINISVSSSEGDTHTDSKSESRTNTFGTHIGGGISAGVNTGVNTGIGIPGAVHIGGNAGTQTGANINGGLSFSHARSRGTGSSDAHSDSTQRGVTLIQSMTEGKQSQEATSNMQSVSLSNGQTTQISFENYQVSTILENIIQKKKRLEAGASIGMFATATYVLAPSKIEALSAASIYKSIIMGNTSSVENSAINVWEGEAFRKISSYLRYFSHPEFQFDHNTIATPASVVNAEELALHMSLPKKSVNGISVTQSVCFGRNVVYQNTMTSGSPKLRLGKLYHLGHDEEKGVELELSSFVSHLAICGTTRTGKSNTIYNLLNTLRKINPNIHFLVIEPAKGDYKKIYAKEKDVHVYSTNPKIAPLLVLDPFSFHSESCHVLEHIDRLVGIFSVCWPMEAAMPSVLKQAMLRAYEHSGWNLQTSENSYSSDLFPCISDVMTEIEILMKESKYSAENKGNYIGALNTRLAELTQGLYEMIFSSRAIPERELFDQNVIIDLSRIGSSETRSLLMGLLMIKLQEYRERSYNGHDIPLRHVTVLEEAHNILRASNSYAMSDSANITGKSVQMLSDAMAQMGAYGEGFLIADQSVADLDKSVIRNTNTKIAFKLPHEEDRRAMGLSMGLNEAQIEELSTLPVGVAAIYQRNWREAVLVHIDKADVSEQPYYYNPDKSKAAFDTSERDSFLESIGHLNLEGWLKKYGVDHTDCPDKLNLKPIILSTLPTIVKKELIQYVKQQPNGMERLWSLAHIAYHFFNTEQALKDSAHFTDEDEWKTYVLDRLQPSLPKDIDPTETDLLLKLLLREQSLHDASFKELYLRLNGIN